MTLRVSAQNSHKSRKTGSKRGTRISDEQLPQSLPAADVSPQASFLPAAVIAIKFFIVVSTPSKQTREEKETLIDVRRRTVTVRDRSQQAPIDYDFCACLCKMEALARLHRVHMDTPSTVALFGDKREHPDTPMQEEVSPRDSCSYSLLLLFRRTTLRRSPPSA